MVQSDVVGLRAQESAGSSREGTRVGDIPVPGAPCQLTGCRGGGDSQMAGTKARLWPQ